jgi:signal transduction histidine kinase
MSSSRALILAFIGVALSFIGATVFSEYSDRELLESASSIADNSSPSVAFASGMGGELRRLSVQMDDYIDRKNPVLPTPADIEATRALLRTKWESYLALPTYPGEPELRTHVAADQATLDRAIDRGLDQVATRRYKAADRTLAFDIKPDIDRVNGWLDQIVLLNSNQQTRLATRIRNLGVRSIVVAVILDAVSLVLAGIAAVLVVRLVHRQQDFARRKADELELFGGRVAHDLLSPLQTSALAIDLALREDCIAPPTRTALDRGRAGLKRARTIADGLLAFASAGAQPQAGAHTPVPPVITDVVEGLRGAAESVHASLRVEPIPPLEVPCAPGVLASLVANLVQNAIKYIGEGARRLITVRVVEAESRVRVEVADTGPGLEPGLQERIFELHVRGQGPKPGIGLGLATVKKVAEAHGGSVGVESKQGSGSRFWFELPRIFPVAHAPGRG